MGNVVRGNIFVCCLWGNENEMEYPDDSWVSVWDED